MAAKNILTTVDIWNILKTKLYNKFVVGIAIFAKFYSLVLSFVDWTWTYWDNIYPSPWLKRYKSTILCKKMMFEWREKPTSQTNPSHQWSATLFRLNVCESIKQCNARETEWCTVKITLSSTQPNCRLTAQSVNRSALTHQCFYPH